ncbi:class B sortase [Alloiococcus sp. CFN-8]|uniref:class B sortase n=1 Tax=Alloiococcus sp. CFN-8 TaxID=3416081 RepID=UPI003CFA0B75
MTLNGVRIIKKIRFILLLLCIGVFCYSAYQLISYFYDGYKNEKDYQEIREVYDFEELSKADKEGIEDLAALRKERFAALKEINADVVAWVHVPNTNIDYPVVQGDDNSYYLDHTVEGYTSRVGAIFMDYRNKLSDESVPTDYNTIIYGHHLKSGAMFTSLKEFKDEAFFNINRYIYIDTPEGTLIYEIFSVIITEADYNYIETYFQSGEDFLSFVSDIQKRALFNRDTIIREEDKILTLSTCTYEYEDARLAVFAKLIEK